MPSTRLSLLLTILLASLANSQEPTQPSPSQPEEQDDFSSGLKVLGGVVEKCILGEEPVSGCLEAEASGAVGRALEVESLEIAPGFYLKKSSSASAQQTRTGKSNEPMGLWENIQHLISTRSLTVDFSEVGEMKEEGRKKKKRKLMQYLMIAAATAAAIKIPLVLKAIAMVAGKALMIGSIALVLAGLTGLKKLAGGKHEDETHVHYADTHRADPTAHYLAYSAHANTL